MVYKMVFDDNVNKTADILIVVDVQNCFLNGGSMGNTYLNDSIRQIQQIYELMNQNKYIYLSRDYHPINHISLVNPKEDRPVKDNINTFEKHCRNIKSTCLPRTINNTVRDADDDSFDPNKNNNNIEFIYNNIPQVNKSDDLKTQQLNLKPKQNVKNKKGGSYDFKLNGSILGNDVKVIGTDISYLYFDKYFNNGLIKDTLIRMLDFSNLGNNNNNKIYLKYYTYNNSPPDITKITFNKEFINFNKDQYIIQLTKGEFCEYESYSAFNYHTYFSYNNEEKKYDNKPVILEENVIDLFKDKDNNNKVQFMVCKSSTGLWEHIIIYILQLDKDIEITLNITVCGLVGNFCVMNTVHHGIKLWKDIYSNNFKHVKINFIYSFYGTLFLPAPSDEVLVPFCLKKAYYKSIDDIKNATEPSRTYIVSPNIIITYTPGILNNLADDFKKIVGNDICNFNKISNTNIFLYYNIENKLYQYENENNELTIIDNDNHVFNNKPNLFILKDGLQYIYTEEDGKLVQYKQKYLKYKQKYLQLKSQLNN